ncbi:MAG: nickel pincer cofactor biosynthesis protein LarB [Methanomicrobiales archaeon]|nr:nickel pincer cofactor biosynthesis protein LarB [Methanomicrobiales archaeon]MDD1669043.1 nickel pincer cofactor biosynthesis protein LarB [Methanomicrobiales archaeon]
MQPHATLHELLEAFRQGEISREEAATRIEGLRIEQLEEFARLDLGRSARCGVPEVILAEGKSPDHLAGIVRRTVAAQGRCIVTRVSQGQAEEIRRGCREDGHGVEYLDIPRAVIAFRIPPPGKNGGIVAILTAGTADLPAAEEARLIAEEMGCTVRTAYDVGAAGIHRLFPALKSVLDAHVFIVAAGREGTLPAVVAGLVDRPVIGLPVSSGYGYMGEGRAALASMLQSCSVLAVVNIDAGFTAGAFAARIATMVACP